MNVKCMAVIAAGALTALAAGSPSFAQNYDYGRYRDGCSDRIRSNGTTGALLGGLAGAAVGANLASHHGGRTGGALLGGLAGAALGNNIARSSAKSDCRGPRYRYRTSSYAYSRPQYYGYDGYSESYAYPAYRYETPYYEQPYASGYYEPGYYEPRHRHRHHEHHGHDDDDDEDGGEN
jgi:hypothetical protein